jgi:Cytochrome c
MRLVAVLLALLAALAVGGCGSQGQNGTIPSGSSGDGDGDAAPAMTGGAQTFPPTGNQYVDARRCPACHQDSDPQQTGFMAGTDSPIPGDFGTGVSLYGPNLTPDQATGIGNWDDGQITNAIMNGIDDQGERLCPQMSHFPDMQPDELQSILGYLHSLTAVSHQAPGSHCPPLKP